MYSSIPFYFLLGFAVVVVALWYLIKNILRHNDYKTDLLRQHTRDIANLHDLVTWEKDPAKKTRYTILLAGFYVTLLAMVISFFVYLVGYLQR
jgi:hypothetical protein